MSYRTPIGLMIMLAAAAPAAAQDAEMRHVKRALEVQAQVLGTPGMRMAAVEARVTTGRPYSAEATTEFVQVLADGNRIARKTTVRIYRDNDGRTRREELGTGDAVESISIYDPVGHQSFVLDPKNRTAMKSAANFVYPSAATTAAGTYTMATPSAGAVTFTVSGRGAGSDKAEAEALAKRSVEVGGVLSPMASEARARMPMNASTESLGQQVFDGITAEGTRTTTVIPAGQIGNQQEIRVVSEQWFSPELQVLVMTRHSDPRSGETTYRLTNVIRADPGAPLFEVPADYTVKEPTRMMFKREPALQ